jgi:hypothetical protein
VLGAVLGHVELPDRRLVVDLFYVRDLKGEAIADDDARWTRERPTVAQAKQRLTLITDHGPSANAFTFKQRFAPPA